jgi:hypothetical protein
MRLAGRRLRACAYDNTKKRMVAETIVPCGEDLTVGSEPSARLVVPQWSGATLLVLSADHALHLAPGMRVHMCHDGGVDRVVGTYEDLVAKGFAFPLVVDVCRLNIRIREGMSVFAKYLSDEEADWPRGWR